jgi:hypothetical protein
MLNSALREPFGDPRAARESAELLKRLSDTGLSRFEPDPLAAIAEAEQRLHFRPISRAAESGRDGRNWHFSEVPIVYDLGLECTGGLNRSSQHFILEGKDGVWDGTEIS